MPDCVFVEDAAVVVPEVAVVTRPGAESRRGEVSAVAEALRPFRELRHVRAPGTLDGGDVLRLGRRVFVGMSSRTSREGIDQLREVLSPFGYEVTAVPLTKCLHLKSAATGLDDRRVLANRGWVDPGVFGAVDVIDVDRREPFGANVSSVGGVAVVAAAHPRTRDRLEARGVRTYAVDLSELAKAEGGVTCCSLVFNPQGPS
jgi:dimethylargininase